MGRRVYLGFFTAMLLLAACAAPAARPEPTAGSSGSPDQSTARGRTLVMAARVEMPSLSGKAIRGSGLTSGTVTRLFNAGLAITDTRGNPLPYLTESLPQLHTDSWRVLPDGTMQTTYRLRPKLTWHDGAPLTAEDFAFAWQVYANPEAGTASSPPLNLIEEVTALDAQAVLIRWKQPYPDAGTLGFGGGSSGGASLPPLPRHLLEESYRQTAGNLDSFAGLPYWTVEYVGAGPYKLDRWETGAFLEAAPFDGHALGRAKIPRIRVIFAPDPNTVVANLLAGEAHMSVDDSIRFQQGAILRQQWSERGSAGTVLVYPALWRWTQVQQRAELATPRALLDVRVRRALYHALDRDALNEALFEREGILAETPVQPTVSYYAQVARAIVKYPYDVRRSEELMAEAGYRKGGDGIYLNASGERFSTEANVLGSAQNGTELTIMAAGWRQAGFDIREVIWSPAQGADPQVRTSFPGLSTTSGSGGEGELAIYRSANIPNAGNRWSGANRGAWSAPTEYDPLAEAYLTTLDRAARVEPLTHMARIFTDQVAVLGLYFNPTATAFGSGLTGPSVPAPETSLAWNVHEWEFR